MADGDAAPQDAANCSEVVPLSGIALALREEIMVDVEARLSQKADSLWKRGQAELGKLQQDRKEVAVSIGELQKRQEDLIAEQSAMHGALLDIATKMEFVAMEMREALRAVDKPDGTSANGGYLPEASCGFLPISPSDLELRLAAELSVLGILEAEGPPPGLVLQGLCTPPRTFSHLSSSPPAFAPPLPGSPAVLLSLASVLPSSAMAGSPPAGATRLHIADCLELTSPDGKTAAGRTGGSSPKSVSTSANGSSSSPGSPARADAASPTSADMAAASFGYELRREGVVKAGGGTLRADAPAFVPGGSFAM